jgi:hypothetical protein
VARKCGVCTTRNARTGLCSQPAGLRARECMHRISLSRVQIKPGDVIVNVGQHNVQKQPLANLRELILGEPGSFITLGFQRGGGPQYYDTKMMRGTPDFLDKHMSAPSKPQAQQAGVQAGMQAGMQPQRAAPQQQGMPGGASREQEEIERLRAALSTSQAEVVRLRTNLRSQELQVERNNEELRTYREALERQGEESRQGKSADDRQRQALLQDFKAKFDRERGKMEQARDKSAAVARSLAAVLPTIQALDREFAAATARLPAR